LFFISLKSRIFPVFVQKMIRTWNLSLRIRVRVKTPMNQLHWETQHFINKYTKKNLKINNRLNDNKQKITHENQKYNFLNGAISYLSSNFVLKKTSAILTKRTSSKLDNIDKTDFLHFNWTCNLFDCCEEKKEKIS
jgi:uncharacterized protein YeeX (DUF496 family)